MLDDLLELQKLQLGPKSGSAENERGIQKLREKLPSSILAHFDRLMARGKKPVAMVHNGVCGACHLRIPSGTLSTLAVTTEIRHCENCGRYLYPPAGEPLAGGKAETAAERTAKTAQPARRRRAATGVV